MLPPLPPFPSASPPAFSLPGDKLTLLCCLPAHLHLCMAIFDSFSPPVHPSMPHVFLATGSDLSWLCLVWVSMSSLMSQHGHCSSACVCVFGSECVCLCSGFLRLHSATVIVNITYCQQRVAYTQCLLFNPLAFHNHPPIPLPF